MNDDTEPGAAPADAGEPTAGQMHTDPMLTGPVATGEALRSDGAPTGEGAARGDTSPSEGVPPEATSALPAVRAGTEDLFVEARGSFREKDIAGYVPSPDSEKLRVRLSQFEGPLDLLLHLVSGNALDILQIPIKTIVKEYLGVLDDMRELNLDIAGEFLVMAAQLAHIKSKMLLPKNERPAEGKPEVDPRADLARRLLEYQRFKEAAQALEALPMLHRDVFGPVPAYGPGGVPLFDLPVELPPDDIYTALNVAAIDPIELIRLFDGMLQARKNVVVHQVIVERLSVGARINEMVDLVSANMEASITFVALCERFGTAKNAVIVTFLAILEMTRLKLIRVVQDENGAIAIRAVPENLRADENALGAALASVDEFDNQAASDGPAPGAAEPETPPVGAGGTESPEGEAST